MIVRRGAGNSSAGELSADLGFHQNAKGTFDVFLDAMDRKHHDEAWFQNKPDDTLAK